MRKGARYRLAIAARTVGAIGGGYALAAAFAMASAKLLPMTPSEAVAAATILGVLTMPVSVLWFFGASSVTRAWGWLLSSLVVCALLAWFAE